MLRRLALAVLSSLTLAALPAASRAACPPGPSPTAAVLGCGVRVSWPTISGADSYDLWRYPAAGGTGIRIATSIIGTSFTDTGVQPGHANFYRIASRDQNLHACPGGTGTEGPPSIVLTPLPMPA
ncbi:MAG: hypothetical protein K2Q20_11225, partial [Phycisphaerales bacterium]|nr:hypothetical protein [Phycisphaerales bacterium]